MSEKINTIIFDLGGVLIDWNPRYLYRKLFASEAEVDWFLQNICTHRQISQIQRAHRGLVWTLAGDHWRTDQRNHRNTEGYQGFEKIPFVRTHQLVSRNISLGTRQF